MLERFENELNEAIAVLNRGLLDDGPLSAYPQMRYLFSSMQINLSNVASLLLRDHRKELFHGWTPAAKLYELITHRTVGIPEDVVVNYFPERSTRATNIPIVHVVDYAKKFHQLEDTTLTFRDGDCQAFYNTANHEVKVQWDNCVAEVTFKDARSPVGLLSSPLFHEPYTVEFHVPWMEKLFIRPVIDLLSRPQDAVDDHLQVLNGIWFTLDDKGDSVSMEPDCARQLSIVLSSRSYVSEPPTEVDGRYVGGAQRGFVKVKFKDYMLTIEAEDRYGHVPNSRLKISTVVELVGGHSVYQWYRNPLLVKDIRDNISSIIDELLTIHHENTKDDPSFK